MITNLMPYLIIREEQDFFLFFQKALILSDCFLFKTVMNNLRIQNVSLFKIPKGDARNLLLFFQEQNWYKNDTDISLEFFQLSW